MSKNYTHVARYIDSKGFNVIEPIEEGSLEMFEILDNAVLETLTFEKIDYEVVINEFFAWFNSMTIAIWEVEEITEKDIMNWCRYQDIDFWKVNIVKQFIEDCKK